MLYLVKALVFQIQGLHSPGHGALIYLDPVFHANVSLYDFYLSPSPEIRIDSVIN